MTIDHIGYAVKDIEKAKLQLQSLGFVFGEVIEDRARNIFISFGSKDGYNIELVAPISLGSPVDSILTKIGPSPYHFCFSSTDIENDIKSLQERKFRIAVPLAPAIAFGGNRVVFMYSLSAGLIEIVENK